MGLQQKATERLSIAHSLRSTTCMTFITGSIALSSRQKATQLQRAHDSFIFHTDFLPSFSSCSSCPSFSSCPSLFSFFQTYQTFSNANIVSLPSPVREGDGRDTTQVSSLRRKETMKSAKKKSPTNEPKIGFKKILKKALN